MRTAKGDGYGWQKFLLSFFLFLIIAFPNISVVKKKNERSLVTLHEYPKRNFSVCVSVFSQTHKIRTGLAYYAQAEACIWFPF